MEKKKRISDEQMLEFAEREVRLGLGGATGDLSLERSRVLRYYNSELPRRASMGRSSFVATDVYDGVEAMKAQLVETFSGNPDDLVAFQPLNDQDVDIAKQATAYCTYQIWGLNRGTGSSDFLQAVTHDGLMARAGIVKVYWLNDYCDIEEKFTNASYEDVQAMTAQEDIPTLTAEEDEQAPGTFKGTRTRRVDTSRVCIDPVPPEEFVVKSGSKSLDIYNGGCGALSHATLKTKAELEKEGYDPKKIELIPWSDARSADLNFEKVDRDGPISDGRVGEFDVAQTKQQKVMFYETYMMLDAEDGSGTKLWKVCHAGHVLLDAEQVDRHPFKAFVPLPIPHTFYGNNFAARCIPYQNARTALTRSILDHAAQTTNPRWGVLKGALVNPKEMSENRQGGLVNLNRLDGVKPLEQHSLNPFIFQTLEMLKSNKEESTGISSLSQGLNKDAISQQNSQGLVENLVTLSQQRQKIAARNFASFMIEVYLETHRLVLENEREAKIIEVAGAYQKVDLEKWVERTVCKPVLHLGYGERDRYADELGALHQNLSQDPGMAPLYQLPNKYALVMDAMKARGFDNRVKYLTPPEQVQPPQPDPLKVRELDIKQMSAQAAMLQAQAASVKNEKQANVAALKEGLNEAKLRTDMVFKEREADRQDADVANRIDVAQREMALAEAAPPETSTASVSPSGR